MSGLTVQIEENAHAALEKLSQITGESVQSIVSKAIEVYRRKIFLESANVAFQKMREDSAAWKEEQNERELWDATLIDGQKEK